MAANNQIYGWETQFDTANKLMLHTFSERVQVKSNLQSGEVQVIVDGNIVKTCNKMPVKEYEAFLLGIEDYAANLQQSLIATA